MCSSGSPAIGLIVVRGRRRRAGPGRRTGRCPSSPAPRPASAGSVPAISGQASTATVSASNAATTSATWSSPPSTGTPPITAGLAGASDAGADDRQAVVGLPAQHGDDVARPPARTRRRPPCACSRTGFAHPVQVLAQRVPGDQVEQRDAGQGDAPRSRGPGRPWWRRRRSRPPRSGTPRQLSTLRNSSGPTPMNRSHSRRPAPPCQPGERKRQAHEQVDGAGRPAAAVEPHPYASRPASESAETVDDDPPGAGSWPVHDAELRVRPC